MSDQPRLPWPDPWPDDRRAGPARSAPAADAEQIPFALDLPVALGPEDFFVSDANADAHAMVTGGLRWPEGKLALIGPEGAGKSHLARIWAPDLRLAARDLGPDAALPPAGGRVVVEDAQHLPREAEAAMFHLHNHVLATGGRLLLTADRPPARWGIALPDLASRMEATLVARIDPPDDALLFALLTKLFADRQLYPGPEVLGWIAGRIERSHAAARAAVEALDRAALRERTRVGLALARRTLSDAGP